MTPDSRCHAAAPFRRHTGAARRTPALPRVLPLFFRRRDRVAYCADRDTLLFLRHTKPKANVPNANTWSARPMPARTAASRPTPTRTMKKATA